MRVTFALLADAANVSREGKLNLLGNFDTIYARSFPTAHPHMQLALRLEAEPAEVGRAVPLEVQLAAPDGRVLLRLPGAVTIQRGEPGEPVRLDQILTLANLGFERPGRYTFAILLDGRTAATVPLRVEQLGPTQ